VTNSDGTEMCLSQMTPEWVERQRCINTIISGP